MEGRKAFVDLIERRFKPENKIFLGKSSFSNLKECIDLLLYEDANDSEHASALQLMQYFDTFHVKGGVTEDTSLKNRVKDHIIWKSDKIWKKMLSLSL